jgi:hypothetical protein
MSERISFFSHGVRLHGRAWLPPSGRGPAVIITGSWLTVKEQMPATYAPRLAAAGFVAMTFDFHGFGESEGAPRELESARRKVEDLQNAFAFAHGHPAVEGGKVGALAICASAGYAAMASRGVSHLGSLVMVAPWLHDGALVRELYGGDEAVRARIADAQAARAHYAATGEVRYVVAASNTDTAAAMYAPGDIFDYYLNAARGAVPAWSNRFAVMAWKEWLELDAISIAPQVTVPVRIVTSEASATPGAARRFEAGLAGRHDSVWMEGTQFHFYDDPRTVDAATDHAVAHLRATL